MNGYPYPVLTEFDSAYKSTAVFNIEFLKYVYNEDKVILTIGCALDSETLKKHIQDRNAELVIKTVTGIRSHLFHIEDICDSIDIEINSEDIRANDTITLTAYVVTKNSFELTVTDEMIEEYFGSNFSILLKKGDILAISNNEKLNYNTTTNDFIMISSSEEMTGKGIRISLKDDNHIYVLVSPEFKRAYATLNNPKISTMLGSHLVFEAFVYTLVEIAQDKEDHSNKEWYRLFTQALEITGDDIDSFKASAIDDHSVDMTYIFKIAQEMINNSLETTVITVKENGG
ncbi:MAG: hypothetical protein IKL46_08400 [Clostridia bacterium]|nr:hypothetical protein [Clostridia bacterium]